MKNKKGLRFFCANLAMIAALGYFGHVGSNEAKIVLANREFNDIKRMEEEMLSEAFEYYDKYTRTVANIIQDRLREYNVIDVFAAYLTMQNSGDMSFRQFTREENDYNIVSCKGISVTIGNGVCRNLADNLCHILNHLGYDAAIVSGEMFFDKQTDVPNHRVVYVKYEDQIILLDPMNELIFIKGDKYFEGVNALGYFAPTLTADRVRGFDRENYEVYFYNKNDIDTLETIGETFDQARVNTANLMNGASQDEKDRLLYYEQEIFKDVIYYDTFTNVVKERLDDDVLVYDVVEEVYNSRKIMDELLQYSEESIDYSYTK